MLEWYMRRGSEANLFAHSIDWFGFVPFPHHSDWGRVLQPLQVRRI